MNLKKPWQELHGSKKALRNGVYAALLTAVVLAAVILLNLVLQALPTRYTAFDISTNSMFTLSETSKNMLHELDTDVTAYYLATSGQEDSNITRLLDRYADESSRFTWQQRDPVLYPTFVEQYEGASTGCVVMTTAGQYTVVSYSDMYAVDMDAYYYYGSEEYTFDAENALTTAIGRVTRTVSYDLYELTGHGETALGSDFVETLNNAGVTVQELNLTTAGSIPEEAASLLINAPIADVTAEEAALLSDYLAGGGKLLVATDFTVETPNLDAVLAECGMTRQSGLLVETDADHYPYGYPQTYLLPNIEASEILAGMSSGMMVYTPIAQGIVTAEDSAYSFTPLLTTGDSAYSMENYATAETAAKSDTDPEGRFNVAVAAENSATGARVVWINCPNTLLSGMNQSVSGGNAQFLGCVVNWFNDQQTAAVISGKSMSAVGLSVPNAALVGLSLLFVFVLPIACLVAGVAVCLIRRRR
ncbi:MAG TPA: GldG family protein [Candidatus Gemmiger avistercoris]|uniref:GldG family protein n=1 Tax=Candidatus Gemmiger avistercoris TaxID=2838606 RepID=A0A9D2FJL9_9FIRM|nr:Gldg family protein [uncultured Subdoligranulum sp.]HIZ62443.1 GldG family protein [Candidatus Gemmiger avistercoris]